MDEFETPAPTAEGGDDMGFGADMGASEPLPTFGESEPLPTFGESEPLPTFGESEPLPTFGESEPLPTFGDAAEAAPMGGMDMGGGDMGGMGGDMGGDMGGMGGDMGGGMGGGMGGMGGGEPAVMSDPDPPPGVSWRRAMQPTGATPASRPLYRSAHGPAPRLLSSRQTSARLPPPRVLAHLRLSRLPPSRLARAASESAHLAPLAPAGLRASLWGSLVSRAAPPPPPPAPRPPPHPPRPPARPSPHRHPTHPRFQAFRLTTSRWDRWPSGGRSGRRGWPSRRCVHMP